LKKAQGEKIALQEYLDQEKIAYEIYQEE